LRAAGLAIPAFRITEVAVLQPSNTAKSSNNNFFCMLGPLGMKA